MEAQDKEPVVKVRSKSKRKRHVLKGVVIVAVASLLFGAGLAIGRGNLTVAGLSHPSSTQNADLSYKLNYSSVEEVYSLLRQDYDGKLDQAKLLDGIKAGLASATGDPYTQYFSAKDAKEFNDALSGSFTGIGAELGTDDDKNVVIVSPLSGYPAESAGLKPKDIIGAINGQSTSGMSVDAVVKKVRGPEGTKVKLTIVRGNQTPFDVEITRAKISVPSVKSEIIGNVGYLKINQFGPDTVDLATKAAQNFKDKNVKGVVVDLRGDPGGYLSAAVDVSSLWLDKGQTVVSERRGGQVINTHYATGNNILKGIPTVVLINGGSASASEITAGALRDNNAAKLVGEKSFGKGSVQQVENLSGGSEIKITIARWFTPGGKNIDKQGITPDTIVKISDADVKAGKDPQKDQALILVKQ